MSIFKYRDVRDPGLRERTGTLGYSTGVFHITRVFDSGLEHEPADVQRFVVLHEEGHAVWKHGLIAVLLFPLRPVLLPFLESCADRYAASHFGGDRKTRKKRLIVALRRVYPHARSVRGGWLHGYTWRGRAARAGLS